MRMLTLVCAAIWAIGCGDDAAPEPELEGLWYFESGSKACGFGLYFEGNEYEQTTVCELTNGELAIEVEAGTFTEDGSRITFTPVLSSCADARDYPQTVQYEFLDEKLRIVSPSGVFVLERLEGEATSGQLTYGCFGEDGAFTPMSVGAI